jgi:hypothetical protein
MGVDTGWPKSGAAQRACVEILMCLWLAVSPLRAQEAALTVPAGTRLRVQFTMPVGSAVSRPGDGVEARLLKPVEVHGRFVMPAGAILSGRVLAARAGNKRARIFPMLRLGFNRLTLPDGRAVPVAASLADLGIMLTVDAEGAVMPPEATAGQDVAAAGTSGAIGAGVGGIAGGGKGAATGAGIGTAVGILADLAAHSAQWEDFTLKAGRKAWLRLDADLEIPLRELQRPVSAEQPPQN